MNTFFGYSSLDDQRKSQRQKVSADISIKTASSALETISQNVTNNQVFRGKLCNISYGGMRIATKVSFPTDTIVDILVPARPASVAKSRYTGVIIWNAPDDKNKSSFYGVEFLVSWIRRKLYRKQVWRY